MCDGCFKVHLSPLLYTCIMVYSSFSPLADGKKGILQIKTPTPQMKTKIETSESIMLRMITINRNNTDTNKILTVALCFCIPRVVVQVEYKALSKL